MRVCPAAYHFSSFYFSSFLWPNNSFCCLDCSILGRGPFCPKFVMSDQSLAEDQAIARVFPDSKHAICLFHFLCNIRDNLHKKIGRSHTLLKEKIMSQMMMLAMGGFFSVDEFRGVCFPFQGFLFAHHGIFFIDFTIHTYIYIYNIAACPKFQELAYTEARGRKFRTVPSTSSACGGKDAEMGTCFPPRPASSNQQHL